MKVEKVIKKTKFIYSSAKNEINVSLAKHIQQFLIISVFLNKTKEIIFHLLK
jgi:hypothetical protein